MSADPTPYATPAPAGWYTLRYAGKAPDPPAWTVLSARLDAPGFVLVFHLEQAQYLAADEAAAARAVPLPDGLALVWAGPPA